VYGLQGAFDAQAVDPELPMQAHVMFTIYSTSPMTETEYRTIKPRLMPRQYAELDDALGWAMLCLESGMIPWEIETGYGPCVSRTAIQAIVNCRLAELKRDRRPRIS